MRPRHLMACYQRGTICYVKNIQKLMIYKYLFGLSAPMMKEVFTKAPKYNLRSRKVTLLQNPKIKKYGTDTVAYRLPTLEYATRGV